jgi:ribosomal protein S18 acetylase RimI-like enzyme
MPLIHRTQVRWVTPLDAPAIHAIDVACRNDKAESLERIEAAINAPNGSGRVSFAKKWRSQDINGYLLYKLDFKNHTALITHLAVHPRQQRRGVGTALLSHLLPYAQRIETLRVRMIVPEPDLPLQLFLRSQDFFCTHILRPNDPDQAGSYLFEHKPQSHTQDR